ncbi:zinc finger CCCH domain-containing protein 6 [Rhodamnia argentea]|uniref:Zinc finger CCCH domain-containing protein 6 n=1 Tax=Rhodamnia argentea TaxID=178133 RepID=A0A8B8NX68_9MYRT|nr:zinc finger CCCH domain-containing protein 6 [Rhodamnia argentea]
MRGSHKWKRVTWATDVNLCQVRLFLSDEAPVQVGFGAQDHLQAKTSWLLHSTGISSDDALPPGFEAAHPSNKLQIKVSEIPLSKWKCPPRFLLTHEWQVVAGEESEEVDVQNQREMRVLEAVYPRPSAIPQNPVASSDLQDFDQNESQIPMVPITPIEDEEIPGDASSDFVPQLGVPVTSHPSLLASGVSHPLQTTGPVVANTATNQNLIASTLHGVEPDVAAAASAAFTALMKSNEHGNMIDQELLIQILSDPKMIEKLVKDYGTITEAQIPPNTRGGSVGLSNPRSFVSSVETGMPSVATSSSGLSYSHTSGPSYSHHTSVGMGPPPTVPLPPQMVMQAASSSAIRPATPAKDLNYYKSLIQQHGGERRETLQQYGSPFGNQPLTIQEPANNPKLRDSKGKIMKPCIYFNSSRGCRNGANCAYQHDTSLPPRSSGMAETQNGKRMKLDREITGT